VAVLHAFAVLTALVALFCLPSLLALIVVADFAIDDIARAYRIRMRKVRARRMEAKLARHSGLRFTEDLPTTPTGPPIEQIAADLRRLGRQRTGVASRSPVWFAAVQRAYDQRLALACVELEIPEHLAELTGVDQDIERVRVEGMLQAAGLRLVAAEADWT
jgi:hypothetical protein